MKIDKKKNYSFSLSDDCIELLEEIVAIKNDLYLEKGMRTNKSAVVEAAIRSEHERIKFNTKLK